MNTMSEREQEISTVLQIVANILSDAELTLGTRNGSPVIVKDETTGKLYGILKAGEHHD